MWNGTHENMKVEVVILAAGDGHRMCSSHPKVLHEIGGIPMISHVIAAAAEVEATLHHVVVGSDAEMLRSVIDCPDTKFHFQSERLGTANAVMQALPHIETDALVLILYGDVPLISGSTLRELCLLAAGGNPALLTAELPDPGGYGRIIRDSQNHFLAVVEDRDATEDQKKIREINTGVLAAPAQLLNLWLPQVGNENAQKEYYLPDILKFAVADGRRVETIVAGDIDEILGVNDRAQLARLERKFQHRHAEKLLLAGTRIIDPARIDIRGELSCGANVEIDVNAVFEGVVSLADAVQIGANCIIRDSEIGEGAVVHPFSHIEGATVGPNCIVGPYARLRPKTRLESGSKIGNFVEVKEAQIGSGSKVNHLSYIGNSEIGNNANIGAGTITCNYDGVKKHQTAIGNGVFVGSNATLVAPIELQEDSFVAAGSTITKMVGPGQLAVGRSSQRNIDGWKRPQKPEDK